MSTEKEKLFSKKNRKKRSKTEVEGKWIHNPEEIRAALFIHYSQFFKPEIKTVFSR